MEVQTALLLLHEEGRAASGSPPPPLVDTPTGTMEEEVEQQEDVQVIPSSPVYSVKSAPGIRRNLLLRKSPKQQQSISEKSVYSDGYRRNRRKMAYVPLTNDDPEDDGIQKEEEFFYSPQSTRSVYSDGVRNRRRRGNDDSRSESTLSLPGRLFSPSKSEAVTLLNPSLNGDEDEEESFYSAGDAFPVTPLSTTNDDTTRAEVERLVHRIMPEEDENVESILDRFQGRETVLLQTLATLYEQQHAIVVSKSPPKRRHGGETSNASTPSGLVARDKKLDARRLTYTRAGSNRSIKSSKLRSPETSNASTPSGLVAREKLTRRGLVYTRAGSNRSIRSLGSRLRQQHCDDTHEVQSVPTSSRQKENVVVGSLQRDNSRRSMNSSASFATPRGSIKSCSSSMGAAESLVVNPGSIGSTMRRYWDSTVGGFIEPTKTRSKTTSPADASHRTDPGHFGDGTNNVNDVVVGSRSISGIQSSSETTTKHAERHLAIEFALETGDWEKVEQVGAQVSDNSVSTISTDAELLLGMEHGNVELQFVDDAFENDATLARAGSPSTLSMDAREELAQNIEECANQLDEVIETDDWSAVMEIINKYTSGRGKRQTQDSHEDVSSAGQDGTNEVTLTSNGSSGASSASVGKRESNKDSSNKKAVEENIRTESRETSLLTEEATKGQDVETTAISSPLDSSVQRYDDQDCRERSEISSNGGSVQRSCCSSEKNDRHKHSGRSKDKVKTNKDSKKNKTTEESVEKNTITGMSFDVQAPKEDLSLLSMNSAGKSNYSNPQSELIGKLKKAIKAGDWNEVQILAQSLDTGDIDGIAAIRDFKTLNNDASAREPEPEQSAQDDKEVQLARSISSSRHSRHSENQDHESTSVGMSREEESVVTTKWPHESQDRVADHDDEEGVEAVLPVEAPARPSPPPSNETSQECVCCVVS